MGRIVYFDGPFAGICYDGHILNEANLNFFPWERMLGGIAVFIADRLSLCYTLDGHFTICRNTVCPVRRNAIQSVDDVIWNATIQHYRSRVEHIIGFVVTRHEMFHCEFRGSLETLKNGMILNVHTAAFYLAKYVRYQPFGNWTHDI